MRAFRQGHDEQEISDIEVVLRWQREEQTPDTKRKRMIILFLGVAGAFLAFTSSFPMAYSKPAVWLSLLVYTGIFSLVFLIKKARNFWILFAVVYFGSMVFLFHDLSTGLALTTGEIVKTINGSGTFFFQHIGPEGIVNPEYYITVFLIFACAGVVLPLSYGVLCSYNVFLVLLVSAPVLELGIYFKCPPSLFSFVLLLLCVGAVFTMNQAVSRPVLRQRKSYLDARGEGVLTKHAVNMGLGFAALAGVVLILTGLLIPEGDYVGFMGRASLRNAILTAAKPILPTTLLSDTVEGDGTGGITGGELGKVGNYSFSGETALVVTTGKLRNSIYLKGFTGTEYTGHSWKESSQGLIGEEEKLGRSINIAPWQLSGRVLAYDSKVLSPIFHSDLRNITVQNINGDKKYVYVPYNATDLDYQNGQAVVRQGNASSYQTRYYDIINRNNNIFLNNSDSIRSTLLNNLANAQGTLTQGEVDGYFEDEKRYRDFVYQHYTALPNNLSKRLYEDFGGLKDSYTNKESLIKTVAGRISAMAAYTLNPGKTPADRDFVEYFLYDNKMGYCNHFASAAVLIFRMAGVPARYAEGYIVTVEDYTKSAVDENGEYVIEVKDTNSHAWAEVYLDGFGWVPVETTPAFAVLPKEPGDSEEGQMVEYKTASHETQNDIPVENPRQETKPASGQSGSEADISGAAKEKSRWGAVLLIPLYLVAGMVLLAVPLGIRRKKVNAKRQRLFGEGGLNCRVVSIYDHLTKVLALMGIRQDSTLSPTEFAQTAEKACAVMDEGAFSGRIHILYKAVYSRGGVSKEEWSEFRCFAQDVTNRWQARLSPWQRIVYQYYYAVL